MFIPPPIFTLYGLVSGRKPAEVQPAPGAEPAADIERRAFLAGWRAGFDTGQNATLRLPKDDEPVRAWMDWKDPIGEAMPTLRAKADRRATPSGAREKPTGCFGL